MVEGAHEVKPSPLEINIPTHNRCDGLEDFLPEYENESEEVEICVSKLMRNLSAKKKGKDKNKHLTTNAKFKQIILRIHRINCRVVFLKI